MAIIGIDFDGTCVTDLFPYVGDNIGAASVLRKLADKNLLILYTVRDGKYLGDASGKEGQFSDSDKKTAENFGCEYMDVDDFVYKYKG